MNPDLPYRIGFSKILEIGPVGFSRIVSLFGSVRAAWNAPLADYEPLNLGEKTITSIKKVREQIDPETELCKCQKLGVATLTPEDEDYPPLLKEIYDPPFLLYVRGSIKSEDSTSLAVVGSRRMTSYGFSVIEALVPRLSLSGLTIVSGLAFGVDAAAHRAALKAGGRAIAVLASGVDNITPAANAKLGEEIIGRGLGAVVSEFPLGVSPQPFYFPRRNRIISGLSLGVLVVEAAEKSGSLITAKAALEQGREVFSVPSSIFNSLGRGTNSLIKEGAKMVTDAADVLNEINVTGERSEMAAKTSYPMTEEEEVLYGLLEGNEQHIDELVRLSKMPVFRISGVLTLLEIKGMVKNIGQGFYRKVKTN